MHGILNKGNVVFLEIFHFSKDSHLCWKFRRLLPLVILKITVCGSICLWSNDGMFLNRLNRISWRKTCHSASFLYHKSHTDWSGTESDFQWNDAGD